MAGLDQFWAYVWQISWQSVALAAVVLAVNLLLRRAMPASWRCALWLLVAVRLMVPMLPGSSWSVFNLLQPREAMPVLIHPVGHTTITVKYGPISSNREQPTKLTLPGIHRSGWMVTGTAIWLLGIFILLGRQIVNEYRGVVMGRDMPQIAETRVLEMVERCRRRMNLWRRVRAVSSTTVRTPAICGFWRATLILPAENQLSAGELEMVISHELAHVRRFDLQIDRLLSILRAVHWFNPIAWFLLRNWRREREMACDETVLRIVGENHRTQYGRVILDMVEKFSTLQPAAGAVELFESSSNLHRRIRMIGSYNPSRIRWTAGMFIALGVAGCLLTDAKAENTTAPTTTIVLPPASDDGESTRVYDISDLIVRHTEFSKFMNVRTDDFEDLPSSKPDPKKIAEQHQNAVNSIIKAIHDAVPNSWKDKEGNGVITQIVGQDQLIISQTEECHDKISKMLAIMRHIANRQVNIEAHFITLNNALLGKLGFAMGENATTGKSDSVGAAYLDDQQVKTFLKTIQNDKRSTVVLGPRVTFFDHQQAYLAIEQQQAYVANISEEKGADGTIDYKPKTSVLKTGQVLSVRADIATNQKFVTVNFHARDKRLVELKEEPWMNDPQLRFQKPVVDIHEGQSIVSIPNSTTLMVQLKDKETESLGRSTWLLLRPEILQGRSTGDPSSWDLRPKPANRGKN